MNREGAPPIRIVVAAVLAAAVLVAAGRGNAAEAPKASTCVACHTDAARLQDEARGVPAPTGSALQSGKG